MDQRPSRPEGLPAEAWLSPETRRALFGKGALVAGAAGLAALAHAGPADAAVPNALKGFNNVQDPPPGMTQGAKGDGLNDDTPAIQAWINASAVDPATVDPATSNIGAVYFPPGIYLVNKPLILPSFTVLIGHGPLSVIKSNQSASRPPGAVLKTGDPTKKNQDIRIENLTVDGNKASFNLILINGNPCERIYISRVEGRNNFRTTVSNSGFAVSLNKVRGGTVEDCYIHDCGRDGITLNGGCEDVVIQGNVVRDCRDDHIAVNHNTNRRVSIVGNVCNAGSTVWGSPITVRAAQVKVVGNLCVGGYRGGIQVDAYLSDVEDVEIAGNLVVEAGNTSRLPFPGSSEISFPQDSSVIVGNGILVRAQGKKIQRVNVKDNLISAPRHHGVSLLIADPANASLRDIAIAGNLITDPQTPTAVSDSNPAPGSGVASLSPPAQTSEVRLSGNDIRDADGPGIAVSGSNNKRWDIQDNRVINSGRSGARQPGILVDGAADLMIVGNRAQDTNDTGKTQSHGLRLVNPAGRVLVTNNDFSGNADGAIDTQPEPPASTTHVFENVGADLL